MPIYKVRFSRARFAPSSQAPWHLTHDVPPSSHVVPALPASTRDLPHRQGALHGGREGGTDLPRVSTKVLEKTQSPSWRALHPSSSSQSRVSHPSEVWWWPRLARRRGLVVARLRAMAWLGGGRVSCTGGPSPSLSISSASTVLLEPSPSVQSSSDDVELLFVQKLALLFMVDTPPTLTSLGLRSTSSDDSSLLFSASEAATSNHDAVHGEGGGRGACSSAGGCGCGRTPCFS